MGNAAKDLAALRVENAALRAQIGQLEALRAENAALRAQIGELTGAVGELTGRVAELTARLRADSSNSSLPPSQDPPSARPRSLRRPSGRKPGGQAGHPGATLEMAEHPDRVVVHRPERCQGCGQAFEEDAEVVGVEARQVFDLPEEIRLIVVEHRLESLCCAACRSATKAAAPAGVSRQVQYGPNIASFAVYLVNRHYVAVGRASELLGEAFGAKVSPGSIQTMVDNLAGVLADRFAPVAKRILVAGPVLHVDETSFKVAGGKMWAHTASNADAAWIEVHPTRGRKAVEEIGVVPRFRGVLVRDALALYDTFPDVGAHQLCTAHVERELQAVVDFHAHPDGAWCWARQAKDAISAAIADPADADRQRRLIESALACAPNTDPDPPGKAGKRHKALRKRLKTRLDDYLRFTVDPNAPPTNNPAEQEIRSFKIKQKIAGTMRTPNGARAYAAIRSYLSTARRHNIPPLQALATLTSTNPWLPTTP